MSGRGAEGELVWTSPYPPIEAEGASLPELVLDTAGRAGDRPALVDGASGQVVSFATLAARLDRVAAGLAARGFGPGDVIALHAPNVPAWAGVALGALRAGGAVTGIAPAATEADVARQLGLTSAWVLVSAPALTETALRAAAASGVRELVAIGEAPSARPIAELLAADAPAPAVALAPERLALLPCSSGTTGLPKAVMLTHGNLGAAVAQVQRGFCLQARDVVLGVAPFAHVMGFVAGLAAPLAAGATVVTLPRFELPGLLAAIERRRVSVLIVPPPIAAALAHDPRVDAHALSSVEFVVCGGAPLAPELQRRLAARLPGATIGQGYGMTETTLPIPIPDRRHGTPLGAVGRLAPSTELRVLDTRTGRDRRAGEPGELWVRGPQVTPGYLNRPDATAELIDRDGWLHTGDVGYIDPDGQIHVVDRLKELIKVNALQVAPAELEALLLTHPHVADAAVVPRPDPRTGESPVAIVVPRAELDPDRLRAWTNERVAPHKRLAAVLLTERIPRTPAGKILRRQLKPLAAAHR